VYYRKYIIRRDKFDWEEEEEDEGEEAEDERNEDIARSQKSLDIISTENERDKFKRLDNISHTGEF